MRMTSERVGTRRCSFSSLHSARVTFLMSPKSIKYPSWPRCVLGVWVGVCDC
jgi:hypothetical protein